MLLAIGGNFFFTQAQVHFLGFFFLINELICQILTFVSWLKTCRCINMKKKKTIRNQEYKFILTALCTRTNNLLDYMCHHVLSCQKNMLVFLLANGNRVLELESNYSLQSHSVDPALQSGLSQQEGKVDWWCFNKLLLGRPLIWVGLESKRRAQNNKTTFKALWDTAELPWELLQCRRPPLFAGGVV